MACPTYDIERRPEYAEDLDAIADYVAVDNPLAAVELWLHIDDQVSALADPNFPRRKSSRVSDAFELVAHENYIVYFDQDDARCFVTVRTVIHVARKFPGSPVKRSA